MTTQRLDYLKAPPGYVVEEMPEAGHLIEAGADIPDLIWRARTDGAVAERRTQEEALSAADGPSREALERANAIAKRHAKPFRLSAEEEQRVTTGVLLSMGRDR